MLFEDILCQMTDMLTPEKEGRITLRDLKRCKLAGNFFNVLFNLNKFIAFETRDPFTIRQARPPPRSLLADLPPEPPLASRCQGAIRELVCEAPSEAHLISAR